METISQNWFLIVLALGVLAYFMFRAGRGGFSHGGGHGGLGLGGFGLGGHGHGGYGGHGGGDRSSNTTAQLPAAVIDAVDGSAVRAADALTSVYKGQVYYFASKENRDRFEASPQEFAAKAAGPDATSRPSHGCGHGC
ncbi:MAG: YHS domain-containing protein [Rhizobiales bacterium]|nr:YHS domain-containing protein [Hyphomicrobiales bacterium]MBI3672065.1 YHS domain-containing protein [Hyphomicrobiales bacterium]